MQIKDHFDIHAAPTYHSFLTNDVRYSQSCFHWHLFPNGLLSISTTCKMVIDAVAFSMASCSSNTSGTAEHEHNAWTIALSQQLFLLLGNPFISCSMTLFALMCHSCPLFTFHFDEFLGAWYFSYKGVKSHLYCPS